MSEEIKEEIKEKKPAKAEKTAPVGERTDGLVAFTKDGVTIRRNAEQTSALEKKGWARI